MVVALGLVAFALVLALVEQVVLAGLEENVQRGSRVFESGHTLVVCFGEAQVDLEILAKTLRQTCHAHRCGVAGGV